MTTTFEKGNRCQCLWEDENWYDVEIMDLDSENNVFQVWFIGSEYTEWVYGEQLYNQEQQQEEEELVVEKYDENKLMPKVKHRKSTAATLNSAMKIIIRLLDSENDFVNELAYFNSNFLMPVYQSMNTKQYMMDEDTFSIIYGGLQDVLKAHHNFFSELGQQFQDVNAKPLIGEILLQHSHAFEQIYSTYHADLETRVLPKLQTFKSIGRLPYKRYLQHVNTYKTTSISTYNETTILNLPILHFTRFKQMIHELLNTNPEDAHILQKCMDKFKDIDSSSATNLLYAKNMLNVLDIEKKFLGNPGFSKQNLFILRVGELTKLGRGLNPSRQIYTFFLFKTAIAYASSVALGSRYKLHGKIMIDAHFFVRKLKDKTRLLIASQPKTLVVDCYNEKLRDEWYDDILTNINEVHSQLDIPSNFTPTVAPIPLFLQMDDIPNYEEIFPAAVSVKRTTAIISPKPSPPLRGTYPQNRAPPIIPDRSTQHKPRGRGLKPSRPAPIVPTHKSPPLLSSSSSTTTNVVPKFCSQCGASRNKVDGKFCEQCGNKFI